jgi:hypothetical protein
VQARLVSPLTSAAFVTAVRTAASQSETAACEPVEGSLCYSHIRARWRRQTMTTRVLPLPPCARCQRLSGVEEDDSSGSSLLWFVCRLCGHRWSVAPHTRR